jgi:hypothetical protein
LATPRLTEQEAREAVEAVRLHGSISGAALALKIPRATLDSRIRRARDLGIDIPKKVYATSTLIRGGEGNDFALQWVKEKIEKETNHHWEEAFKRFLETQKGIARIDPIKKLRRSDLMNVYPIGDHHCGMYSWAAETGADYDNKIAHKLLTSSIHHLLNVSPDTETGLVIDVGDFLHVDNLKNETSRSHHTLDVDTRYQIMIEGALDMLCTSISESLRKHKFVKAIITPGNHNDIGAQWLSLSLHKIFEKNPRVTIDRTPGKFHYHQFGKVLIGVTHGDTGAPAKLAGVMASDQAKIWGETEFRYWITGHVHHKSVTELPGVMWETFRTLAPRDAWSQAAGHRSGRDMTAIVMHKDFGEVSRHRFDVAMMNAA